MPTVSAAQLNICSITGNMVFPIANGMQKAGTQSVTIKKNILPIGVYVISFKTGIYQESKTLLLIK
jgi:hypothetical protein